MMANEITVTCDRCKKKVEGIDDGIGTAGFYHTERGYWSQFVNEGENIICDDCMFNDERYQKVYGRRG
jgi:hypothetical protein